MPKRRKQREKRRDSKAKQAEMHEEERLQKALAQYQGSSQELFDSVNERITSTGGNAPAPVGPDHKPKRRQKRYVNSN